MSRLTQRQVSILLACLQDGSLRIGTGHGAVPDLVLGRGMDADADLDSLPSRPLTPIAPRFAGVYDGQARLLGCMVLHLTGAPPGLVRSVTDRAGLTAIVRHWRGHGPAQ